MRRRPLVLAGLALVAVAGALVWALNGRDGAARPSGDARAARPSGDTRAARPSGDTRSPGDTPRPRLEPGHLPAGGPQRARIEIPSIGVDAGVVDLGLNRDRTLQVPARAGQVGLWKGGAVPGRAGAAIMVGHVDSRIGPAVFFRLRRLRAGDRVIVRMPGRAAARYVVQRSEEVRKDRFPTRRVYSRTRGATLRLITCSGSFDRSRGHYRDNLVVYARAAA